MNTAAKRFSALLLTLPFRGPMVVPSGTVTQGERQAFAFAYSGILFDAPVVLAGIIQMLTLQRIGD